MQELILDLSGKTHIGYVGDPVLQGGTGATEDPYGFYRYNIPVMEVRGNLCQTQQIGVKGSTNDWQNCPIAYYVGAEPIPRTRLSEFEKWMLNTYTSNPENFPGLIVHRKDELAETATISHFDGTMARKFFFIQKNGTPVKTEIPDGAAELKAMEYDIPIDGNE